VDVGDHEDHAAACIRSHEVLELYREERGKQPVEGDTA
jgi:hypothetical protein